VKSAQPPAVLLGLDSMQGLQVARILSDRGVEVHATTSDPRYYSTKTRVCERILQSSSRAEELVPLLIDIADDFDDRPVLIPCQDQSVFTVADNRETLDPRYRIVLSRSSRTSTREHEDGTIPQHLIRGVTRSKIGFGGETRLFPAAYFDASNKALRWAYGAAMPKLTAWKPAKKIIDRLRTRSLTTGTSGARA
jgi:hypothetical protein